MSLFVIIPSSTLMRSETVSEIHRRDFLKISAAGAVAASLPNALHALSSDSPAGSITAVTTDTTRKYVSWRRLRGPKLRALARTR
jgi:hypothetical protein